MSAAPWDENAALWFLVRQVAARLDRSGDALYRDGIGVSLAQFLVLSVVDAYPGTLNQQVVADRLGLTKGTVSRQIDNAVTAGYMTATVGTRSRREKILALTDAGTDLVRSGDELLARSLLTDMPGLRAEDVATTIRTLAVINGALGGLPTPGAAIGGDAPARPPAEA